MSTTVLVLGHTGKLGSQLVEAFGAGHRVVGKCSRDFDALDPGGVESLLDAERPDIVVNAVAQLGIDPCEKDPGRAFRLNAAFPGHLAELCRARGLTLVHVSTDAVFSGSRGDYLSEEDPPDPVNVYGLTKLGGELLVRSGCPTHYIVRVPLLFGPGGRGNQFVERMIDCLAAGTGPVRVSDDIVSSPTYARDAAFRIADLVSREAPHGLYHVANEGKASLYEIVAEIAASAAPGVRVERASYRDFPHVGRKNTVTPLRSVRTSPLRPWREAVADYLETLHSRGD